MRLLSPPACFWLQDLTSLALQSAQVDAYAGLMPTPRRPCLGQAARLAHQKAKKAARCHRQKCMDFHSPAMTYMRNSNVHSAKQCRRWLISHCMLTCMGWWGHSLLLSLSHLLKAPQRPEVHQAARLASSLPCKHQLLGMKLRFWPLQQAHAKCRAESRPVVVSMRQHYGRKLPDEQGYHPCTAFDDTGWSSTKKS